MTTETGAGEQREGFSETEIFKAEIDNALAAAGVESPDSDGNRSISFRIDDTTVEYTDYGPEPEGYGKKILWVKFKPTYALSIHDDDVDVMFAIPEENPTAIIRRYRSGGIIPRHGGLPNLFTSERYLEPDETRDLIDFTKSPHLKTDLLPKLFKLSEWEAARKNQADTTLADQNDEMSAALARMARSHTLPGNIN